MTNAATVELNIGFIPLLDAALMNGVELPHDCRSGYCGTCRVRVLSGHTFGGASRALFFSFTSTLAFAGCRLSRKILCLGNVM